jgi:hypothetical protein
LFATGGNATAYNYAGTAHAKTSTKTAKKPLKQVSGKNGIKPS